jgi:hypothetical protein
MYPPFVAKKLFILVIKPKKRFGIYYYLVKNKKMKIIFSKRKKYAF